MADLLGIGTIVKAGVDVGKTIYGASQFKKGKKEVESALSQLKYTRPEEYGQIMSLLKSRRASLPSRQAGVESRIRQSTASSTSGIRQLADSPVAALGAYSGLKQREQQAIADLGIQFEGMKDEALMAEAQGLQMGAEYSDKEQYWNDMYKKMVKANMGAARMNAGQNMMWGGVEGAAGAVNDYLGTKYLADQYGQAQ